MWPTPGDQQPQEDPLVIQFSVKYKMLPLPLNDHVVHDHTCIHDLPHLSFQPAKRGVPVNSKSSLKHTKCMLDILSTSLLTLSKLRLFPS
jgi:hypothetical protein